MIAQFIKLIESSNIELNYESRIAFEVMQVITLLEGTILLPKLYATRRYPSLLGQLRMENKFNPRWGMWGSLRGDYE